MITIFKGDSMDSRFGREITFSLEVPEAIDTTGCSVVFGINGVETTAALEDGEAVISFTAAQTERLFYGTGYAAVVLTDGTHRRTVTNSVPVRVTDNVGDVDGSQNTISVRIECGFEEALKGVNWDAGGTIASLRDFLARVGGAMGATVTAR